MSDVTMNAKLTYKIHLERGTSKDTKAFYPCRGVFSKKWGLKSVIVH